ncbi:MAG: hypothetical protein H5T69_05580 [Chloroflexi bacterium]|nr:hypothetical protein [Chloroflexota bacterium]
MAAKKVLFISGSFGLGHIFRDLAIANQLRQQRPEIRLSWMAGDPARGVLEKANENLLPEAAIYTSDSVPAENAARGVRLNLLRYTLNARKHWAQNVKAFIQATERERFDCVIADEAYELAVAILKNPRLKKFPFAFIYDFVGLDSMTWNPLEKLGIYYWNRVWAQDYTIASERDALLFVGELEDIPDRPMGPGLPSRQEHARRHYRCVGYILPFDPSDYRDTATVKHSLGYGDEPLVICSVGGTSIGRELLELCGRAFPIASQQVPTLRMVMVCGPRLATASVRVPAEVEIRGYVPQLYEHLAACDLAIVQGGGTITLELTALRRPFLFFPREGDCEQEIAVAGRLARHGAGVRMSYSETTPESLAEAILVNLGREIKYPPIPTDGAQRAAEIISALI